MSLGARAKILIPVFTVLATLAMAELVAWAALRWQPDLKSRDRLVPPPPPRPSPFALPETFGQLPRHPPDSAEPADYSVQDDFPWAGDLVWTPPASASFTVHYRNGKTGAPLWQTTNTTDPQGRRIPPWQEQRKKTAKRHVFAAGCSFTWGHGVSDGETFLARMSKDHPDLITYNAGVGGYSISEILARAQTSNVMDDIAPKEGVGLYVAFREHLPRFTNSAFLTSEWRRNGIVMSEPSPGVFKPLGFVEEVEPFWSAFSAIWASSSFVRLFHLDLPILTDSVVNRFMREVKAFRQIYWEKTQPTNPFVVVLFPYAEDTRILRDGLTRAEIPFLDYGGYNPAEFTRGPSGFKGDGHPTPELHEKVAIALERDLRAIMDEKLGK